MNIFKKLFGCKESKPSETENLSSLFILRDSSFPCEKCNLENEYCKKLSFADRTICVAPRDKVNFFSKKKSPRKR